MSELLRFVTDELRVPVPEAVAEVSDAIRTRHGDATLATLFYGSCLRRDTLEGVLDFFVLVSSYRAAYRSARLRWLNRAAPPNVFQLEVSTGQGVLRTKYAVISIADFERAARFRHLHPHVWGRFAQPAVLVWARDDRTRSRVASAVAAATATAARRGLALARPEMRRGRELELTGAGLWQTIFARSYATELRTEAPATIRSVFDAAPERYRRVTGLALARLERRGTIAHFEQHGDRIVVHHRALRRPLDRLGWWLRLPLAKAAAAVRLLKGIATFDGWLGYVLWKLERHTGVRISPSARQRRHPLIFGWPLLFQVLRRGNLR
ncbi:MAG: hypothetical protein AB7R55_08760 [Gemmatimonadales bacterium]